MANISAIKLPDGITYDIVDKVSKEIFIAEYDVTTYSDVLSAVSAGKKVIATKDYGSGSVGYFELVNIDSLNYNNCNFIRLRGNKDIPTQYLISLDSNDVWTSYDTVLGTFPVGSIYVTSTNSNPSSYLGGTWSLFDKEFTNKWETTGFTWNTTNTQDGTAVAIFKGHTVEFRFQWNNKVAISDDSKQICTFANQNYFTNGHNIFPIAYCDALNAIGIGEFGLSAASNANFQIYDWVTKATSYPTTTGQPMRMSCTFVCHDYTNMVDSKCNKFYWKRTA